MAIAETQSVSGSGATVVINGVAANSFIVIVTSYFRGSGTGAPATPTDTNGTPAVAIAPTPADGGGGVIGGCAAWFVANANSGTHTIGGLESSHNTSVTEFSGIATSTPLDVSTSNKSIVNAHTSQDTGTTGTTAQASELSIIGLCLVSSGGSSDVGFTDPVTNYTTYKKVVNDFSDIGTFHAYRVLAATGTQTATFNWTDNETSEVSQAVIATFKGASAGFTPAFRKTLSGIGTKVGVRQISGGLKYGLRYSPV